MSFLVFPGLGRAAEQLALGTYRGCGAATARTGGSAAGRVSATGRTSASARGTSVVTIMASIPVVIAIPILMIAVLVFVGMTAPAKE